MRNLDLSAYGVEAMSKQDIQKIDGGFIPVVIWGVVISAKAVAGWLGGCAIVGATVGVAVYNQREDSECSCAN